LDGYQNCHRDALSPQWALEPSRAGTFRIVALIPDTRAGGPYEETDMTDYPFIPGVIGRFAKLLSGAIVILVFGLTLSASSGAAAEQDQTQQQIQDLRQQMLDLHQQMFGMMQQMMGAGAMPMMHQGWGPGMMGGPGMMMGPGYGPGMMGCGYGGAAGMMTGPGYGMGPGMMYGGMMGGPGYGAGPGMMNGGMMGSGTMGSGMMGGGMMNGAGAQGSQALWQAERQMHQAMNQPYSGDADRDFVAHMIAHHEGAVAMAQAVLQYGKDPQIKQLAQDIVAAQQKELDMMKDWLAKHPAGQ
jgi:DUF305 family protein family protein